jgi:hypothetical protein
MAPLSVLIVSVLAQYASAFPSIRGMRREAASFSLESKVSVNVPEKAATSSFPAWHPPQNGEGNDLTVQAMCSLRSNLSTVRSPCPGLNALANHNICPRSGTGYTIPILIDCLKRGLNVGADFATIVGTAGIASNPNPLLSGLYFDLDMLDRHDFVIEHDASLSRADASTGNNYSFNQTIWNTVLAYYNGMEDATIPVAARAKYNRVTTEYARDPTFSYGPLQFILSYGETALYLSTMGDPITGVAPVDHVRSLFEQERLPYELGWLPPKETTTLATLGAMAFELNAANGEEIPEGLIIGEKSLAAAFIGLNTLTGEVENQAVYALAKLTGALADVAT